jgi:transcriptional regulator of nitric oxide reductase
MEFSIYDKIYLLQMATIIHHSCLSWTRMLTGVAYGCLMSREMVILNIRHSKFGGDDIHNSWVFLKGTISLPTSTAQRPS